MSVRDNSPFSEYLINVTAVKIFVTLANKNVRPGFVPWQYCTFEESLSTLKVVFDASGFLSKLSAIEETDDSNLANLALEDNRDILPA